MKTLKIIISTLVLSILLAGCAGVEKETVTVGSKDFTEQYILGNILVLLIENNTNLDVVFKENMASHVIFSASETGAIDIHVDYTGTIYGYYLNHSETRTAEEVHEIAARELLSLHNLRVLGKLGFNNTFCLAVRRDTAEQYNLRTFSDLAEVSANFAFGGSAEIISRNDGLPNLKRLYNMTFREEKVMHDVERYQAVTNDEIQVAEVFSTDALILEYDLVVLEDDLHFFPPYHGVIVIRNEVAEKHPELLEIFGMLEGLLPDEVMRSLNYRVDVLGEAPRNVAESFLRDKGLIR